MKALGTQILHTPRLTLRPLTRRDASDVFAWMGDPEVAKYERWQPHPNAAYTQGYIREALNYRDPNCYQWGLESDGRLIGQLSVVAVDSHDLKAVVGYMLRRDRWNQGFMTEALQAVVAFMFTQIGLNRLEASHALANPASGRVLEKAGFQAEGTALEYYRANTGFMDSRLYGLTRAQFERMAQGASSASR